MNDLDWRRRLRALQQDTSPRRDLWPSLAIRMGSSNAQRTPSRLVACIAAALLLSGGLAAGAWHRANGPMPVNQTGAAALLGARSELDSAQIQLRLALRQAPDAHFLKSLLARTQRQELRLQRLHDRAG